MQQLEILKQSDMHTFVFSLRLNKHICIFSESKQTLHILIYTDRDKTLIHINIG